MFSYHIFIWWEIEQKSIVLAGRLSSSHIVAPSLDSADHLFFGSPVANTFDFFWTVKLNLLISPHFFILRTVWLLLFSLFACHCSLSSQSLLHASPTISFHLSALWPLSFSPPLSTLPIISFSSLCPLLCSPLRSYRLSSFQYCSSPFLLPFTSKPPPLLSLHPLSPVPFSFPLSPYPSLKHPLVKAKLSWWCF